MGKQAGKWAAGAMLAGVAGYVVGVLTAPKSGKETRADIANAALKAKTEAEKKLKLLHSQLQEALEAAKQKASKLRGSSKKEFDVLVDKATNAKEKVREALSAIHEGDANDPDLKKAISEAKAALKHLEKYAKS